MVLYFFTSNVSAPLKDIIKVNGFWEIADLTREEDILMGLALDKIGRKFYYADYEDIKVFRMEHYNHTEDMKRKKYKEISYDELGQILYYEYGKI